MFGIMTSSTTRSNGSARKRVETRRAVVRDVGAIALGFEVLADAGREMRLVVDDENAGAALSSAAAAVGQRIDTVAPRPGPSLAACTVPPESSTRRFTM